MIAQSIFTLTAAKYTGTPFPIAAPASAPKENSAIKRAFRSSARWISSPSSTIWAAGLIVAQAAAWASSSRWRQLAPASKRLNKRRDNIQNEFGTEHGSA